MTATLDDLRARAGQAAAASGSPFVGSEHFFLAWLREGSGAARTAMIDAGVTAESFEKLIAAQRRRAPASGGALAPQAEGVLAAASGTARTAGREATWDDVILV
ncbi:MAG: Clp protease N-terminal domain-containing protein, partial [Gemmatimonadales bacterium]